MACKYIFNSRSRLLNSNYTCTKHLNAYLGNKTEKNDELVNKTPDSTEVTKEELQWRTEWAEQEGAWYSKLKVFSSDKNNTDVIRFLQTPIDFRPSTIKKWYFRRQEEIQRQLQLYIPKRNEILGDELAAAHFIVFRGGAVQFHGEESWIKQDENLDDNLPKKYDRSKQVKAINCSGVDLFYEGLENLRGLETIEWLSLNGCSRMDDWCMDRISGSMQDSLEYLDIRNCSKITERGIGALYRTTKLRTLLLDDVTKSKELELTCLMLQELNPQLVIKSLE